MLHLQVSASMRGKKTEAHVVKLQSLFRGRHSCVYEWAYAANELAYSRTVCLYVATILARQHLICCTSTHKYALLYIGMMARRRNKNDIQWLERRKCQENNGCTNDNMSVEDGGLEINDSPGVPRAKNTPREKAFSTPFVPTPISSIRLVLNMAEVFLTTRRCNAHDTWCIK